MSFNPVSLRIEEECRICLEPIKEGTCHQAGAVFHVFHEACLTQAIAAAPNCPLCRERIFSINGKAVAAKVGEDEFGAQIPQITHALKMSLLGFSIALVWLCIGNIAI
jgi:hypothetical protein